MYIHCKHLPNGSGAPSLSPDAPSATPKSDELHPTAVQTKGAVFATFMRGIASLSPPVPLLANLAVDAGKPAQVLASPDAKKPFNFGSHAWQRILSEREPKLKGFGIHAAT